MGYGNHWGMMDWGMGGFWPFGMIIWIIIIIAIIALISWAVHALPSSSRSEGKRTPSALDVLEERYARGEIGRDEYLQKKSDILGR
jgi:putative membrane protein